MAALTGKCAAGLVSGAAAVPGLHRWALDRAVRTKDTTITGHRAKHDAAMGAFIKVHARVGRHRLNCRRTAPGACQDRLENRSRGHSRFLKAPARRPKNGRFHSRPGVLRTWSLLTRKCIVYSHQMRILIHKRNNMNLWKRGSFGETGTLACGYAGCGAMDFDFSAGLSSPNLLSRKVVRCRSDGPQSAPPFQRAWHVSGFDPRGSETDRPLHSVSGRRLSPVRSQRRAECVHRINAPLLEVTR